MTILPIADRLIDQAVTQELVSRDQLPDDALPGEIAARARRMVQTAHVLANVALRQYARLCDIEDYQVDPGDRDRIALTIVERACKLRRALAAGTQPYAGVQLPVPSPQQLACDGLALDHLRTALDHVAADLRDAESQTTITPP